MDKNKAVYEYLQNYPQLHSWLYFNTVENAPNNASMLTGNDVIINEYIDGSNLKNYIFSVAFLCEYDTGTSDINSDAVEEVSHFVEWIEEQEERGVFPDFGENAAVISILINDTVPNMAVDNESGIARYTFNVVISYVESKRGIL